MFLNRISYVLQAIGIKGIFRTIQYGFYRDRIEKQKGNTATQELHVPPVPPGKFTESELIPGGIQLSFENAQTEVIVLSDNIIRISWTPGKAPVPYTIKKNDWEVHDLRVEETDRSYILSFNHYQVTVDTTGEISIWKNNGTEMKRDNVPVRKGTSWSLSTNLSPDEHIYGLGERSGPFNLRPGIYKSWNTDAGGSYSEGDDPLYIGTPIYLSLSSRGSYLVYFENPYQSVFKVQDKFQATFMGGMLRYYVILGSLETIYTQLCELIGYPNMAPRWVFGYHQSRWGYKSEAEIRDLVRKFKEFNLPLSAIHLDIDYMDGFRVFSINRKNFPKMKKLAEDLDTKGIKLVATINPAVKYDETYHVFRDGNSKHVFCTDQSGELFTGVSWPGWSVFPDFTNVETRKWWQNQYSALLNEGISGIWHDMNEPASFAAWGDKSLPINLQHSMDGTEGDHLEAHNLYGLLMNQAGYEGIKTITPNKRPWIFSRAGWAGLQRYAWNWTGDIESSWEALKLTVPMILGLSLSGHFFSGVDIGGFSGNPSAELYLRWFQLSSFLPLFRTHSAVGTKQREPWVFGEPTTSILRKFLQLRYKLIPYFYSLAWEASHRGIPAIRPIFWEYPQDKTLWDVPDEFLVGSSLLLAPIVDQSSQNRSVIFPPGSWYSLWDDREYQGISSYEIPTDMESIPIFIKSGSIIPMEENNELTLHIYSMEEGMTKSYLYFDDGDGYGPWRLETFNSTFSKNHVEISWDKSGEYQFPYSALNIHMHGRNPLKILIDNKEFIVTDNIVQSPIFQNIRY